jgi:hypothetical protein
MKKLILILLMSSLLSFSASAQIKIAEVRLTACKYLGYDPNFNEDDVDKLIQECIKKFDKKVDQPIDFNDIDMLYGLDDGDGVIDYLYYMYNMQGTVIPPTTLELSMRRFLGESLKDINKKISETELMNTCFELLGRESGITAFDIPFLVDDGFLRKVMSSIEKSRDMEEKGKLLAKLGYLIEKTSQHVMLLGQRIKLDEIEAKYNLLDFDHTNDLVNKKITANDIRVYLLTKYFNSTNYYLNQSTDALIEEALVKILLKEKALSDVDIELLIGKGGLYYYLAQQAEALPDTDPKKTQRMAQVFLLASYIYECHSFYSASDLYKGKLFQFNMFYARYGLNDWMNSTKLPDRYMQELKERRLKIK